MRETAKRLRSLAGERVEVFTGEEQSGVLSFRPRSGSCTELAEKLSARGFCLRAGCHCAPLAHETAGTLESGTVRASFSAFNTPREAQLFARTVAELTRG